MNFLSNALKFTSAPGFVSVKSTHVVLPENQLLVQISVADNGIGVSQDKREYLFQPFRQADESTTRLFGGSGLGLAISKSLATLLGGNAWLGESEVGTGSTFHFTFKAGRGQKIPSMAGKARNIASGAFPKAVVLAPPIILSPMLMSQLHCLGVQCEAVTDLMSLRALLSRKGADLAVVDIRLDSVKDTDLRSLMRYVLNHCTLIPAVL